eukprot:TRINITY_DN48089_c0_g1_i1.p1 TRINITY_DN48089_c0_g1~~TRINITY_DN48089_c0_g1_i1.p1  ORF type:complete len:388 (-),score=67.60 TRINITY_DN48089_c0_g1_i1:57-1220(-)
MSFFTCCQAPDVLPEFETVESLRQETAAEAVVKADIGFGERPEDPVFLGLVHQREFDEGTAGTSSAVSTNTPSALERAVLALNANTEEADFDIDDLEWEHMRASLDSGELAKLRGLRLEAKHLDAHGGCAKVPHAQRALTLLRFLRAQGGNVRSALTHLSEALDWRRDFDLERKLEAWQLEWDEGKSARVQLLRKYDFVGCLGNDKEGLPVYVTRFSQGDPGGLVRELGEEVYMLRILQVMEGQAQASRSLFLKTGRLVLDFVEVFDLGMYGLVQGWLSRAWGAVPIYKRLAPLLDCAYPERVRCAMVLRAPAAFSVFWRIAQPLVPEETRKRVRIRGSDDEKNLEDLREFLHEDCIPQYLRSQEPSVLQNARPWGGVVPRGALRSV